MLLHKLYKCILVTKQHFNINSSINYTANFFDCHQGLILNLLYFVSNQKLRYVNIFILCHSQTQSCKLGGYIGEVLPYIGSVLVYPLITFFRN